MSSNTNVGPAGENKSALPVKDHQTFNKKSRSESGASGSGAPGSNTGLGSTGSPVNNGGS